ncbi:cytochrome C assembly family protein [Crenothrix polyspora]|uniref:Cytochrome c assembly protein n=1 Tax=Crenothrix polyspora TaxID=360316 RepID=A0A1R4H7P2_9GAMM|nr:cytochrome c biogenesis protein CcsA [Crenothrix polyspora]SJM92051.1 Cytochrome c assembly protein [Crenothrix polyspora]
MIILILGLIAIMAYLGETGLIIRRFYQNSNAKTPYLAWLAVSTHLSSIALSVQHHNAFNFGFFTIGSLIALMASMLLLMTSLNKPVVQLGIVLFPLTGLMLALAMIIPQQTHRLLASNWQMNTHILSSVIAFGLLNIAALQAILLYIQNQQLKSHPPKRFIQKLPSLQTMEVLLFQMLGAGIFFLTVSLGSGFLFIEDLFAQHLVHKTVLSILAWFIFSGLLVGRSRYGWRGKTAIQWTLIGFVALLLAYFGSKLVLELILQRQ